MKTREEISQNILSNLLDRSGFDDWWYNLDFETQSEIQQGLEKIITDNTNQSKWISVKDDKPKDGQDVLAIIFADGKYYTPFSCTYSKELGFHEMDHKYYLKDWYEPYNNDVTHWQSLPEPPK